MVTEELWVCWDLIQEDLGHLQRPLQWGGGGRQKRNKTKKRDSVREAKKEKAETEWRKERAEVRGEAFERA